MTRRSPDVLSREWQLALLAALGLHVALMAGGAALSRWLNRPITMPPIYTVDLFSVQEPRMVQRVESKTQEVPVKSEEKPPPSQKEAEKPAPAKPPQPEPAPKAKATKTAAKTEAREKKIDEAVSLRPRPTKEKPPASAKNLEPKPDELLAKRLRGIEDRVKEKREDSFLQKRLAGLQAGQEAKARQGGPSSGQAVDEILRDYVARHVYPPVRQNWALPEQLLGQSGLVCVVVVQIAEDGSVVKSWLERGSGVSLFDQSVLRAISEAAPFAPLPSGLKPGPLELGIRFKPGEVGG